ncbi:MAG: NAD-dependent epimerase/dehydratase family protein [Defluviitaleaceae bacterium]|nr:NAD-dependent epimerase/dehydratase family protein [Defluviitaleaceae bacterium]MCL2240837.1 NAD-dependent epimerase/dehydratase family protein [Defluviitaleaceae bacterium]
MKRVLVIGHDSYIGRAFEAFARDKYEIKMCNSHNGAWEKIDFSGYSSILHCAGIAHVKKIKKELYEKINCELAVRVAQKAKNEGVPHFIFLSSMAVYGNHRGAIYHNTPPKPATQAHDFYGESKYRAEQELNKLAGDVFSLSIVRPPMVYGQGCKGNFPRLVKWARRAPFFPDYPNQRSMIYIDNLCAFFCEIINNKKSGILLPQNTAYVNTVEMVKHINPKVQLIKTFNPLIKLFINRVNILNKLFGDLYYIKKGDEGTYERVGFEESVRRASDSG